MGFQLRDYQLQGKQQIYNEWVNHDNVLYVLPTGLGKTKLFTSIAKELAIDNDYPVAIKVHRKELLQQISLSLCEVGVVHNIIAPRKTISNIIAAQRKLFNKQFYHHKGRISVISVDTLNARAHKFESWAKSIKYWITDEAAHLLRGNKWGRAVEFFPNAKGLGVTATPERLDKKGLGRHADGVFDTMIVGPDTAWGIMNGYLSKYKIAIPSSDYQNYLKAAKGNSDFTKQAMNDAAKKSKITGDVVENYRKFADGRQAILFAPSISVAEEMKDSFNENGIPADLLTGDSSDVDRLQGMINFRDKKTKVLLNVDLFDEGLDVPGIECVIHARPTMSISKYKQINGRGLRPMEGKEFCMIIDHVGNVMRHGLPDKPYEWTLDRIEKKRKGKSLLKICNNPTCAAPYDRFLPECPYCGEPAAKAGGGGERVPPEMVDGDLELIDPYSLDDMYKSSILESPEEVAKRVAKAAGQPAAIKAMRNQEDRIKAQEDLKEAIANLAGRWRDEGLVDREIHKRFFLQYDQTIAQALSQPKAKMTKLLGRIG